MGITLPIRITSEAERYKIIASGFIKYIPRKLTLSGMVVYKIEIIAFQNNCMDTEAIFSYF